jgi:hypothetical protein
MAVSYLTTRPTSGPPYTTSGDAAGGLAGVVMMLSGPEADDEGPYARMAHPPPPAIGHSRRFRLDEGAGGLRLDD